MKTWHAEAAVMGLALALAWAVDQVFAGAVDAWSLPALLLLYTGTRQASVSARVKEASPPGRADLVECYQRGRRYDLVAYALGLGLALKPILVSAVELLRHGVPFAPASAGALALVGFLLRLAYPAWRRRWRVRHPRAEWSPPEIKTAPPMERVLRLVLALHNARDARGPGGVPSDEMMLDTIRGYRVHLDPMVERQVREALGEKGSCRLCGGPLDGYGTICTRCDG